ncbi:MAG: cytoskeleton protein RodZ [Zhongshania aliphaticivorans]|jgi:cytoskeleton protein RodZ|tara:strand:+ start:6236 stop:7027 length:792 start_codon:yes stop_codon:yes gene_type:complete
MPGKDDYYPGPPGSVLHDARMSAGKSVLETAEALNLLNSYVEALENNDYSRFNSPLFARGYIKSYARYMGLDEEPLLKDCDRICRREEDNKDQTPTRPQGIAKAPGNAPLISALLISIFLWCVAIWVFGGKPEPELAITVLAERFAPLSAIKVEPSLGEVLLGSEGDELSVETPISQHSGPAQAAELKFEFVEAVWLELRDFHNNIVVSGVQEKGEKLRFDVQGPVTISLAYWPAVISEYNGQKIELKSLVNSNAVRVQVGEL